MSSAHPTKIEVDHVCKPDPRLIWEQCLRPVFLLDSIDLVIPAWNVSTIQGSAQCAEVDEKKRARLRIAPNACVLPRHIHGRHNLNVDRICSTAAADRDRTPDIVGVMT